MSPSRGTAVATSQATSSPSSEAATEARADSNSSSALRSAKQNIKFLFAPDSPSAPRPARLRTRALLRSLRYIGIFVFWRVVRYAKYALVGSVVAAIGASAFGGVISGAAFVLAPPTILTSMSVGLMWAMGKWGFRKLKVGNMAEMEVKDSRKDVIVDGQYRDIAGPRANPW